MLALSEIQMNGVWKKRLADKKPYRKIFYKKHMNYGVLDYNTNVYHQTPEISFWWLEIALLFTDL